MSALIAATALGCVTMGGVFFAFSSFVMRGLGRLPPAQLAGALTYLAGVIGVTMVFNVPLNNAVAAADPASADAAKFWSHYLRRWTAWNHVRTIAGIAAGALLTAALVDRL